MINNAVTLGFQLRSPTTKLVLWDGARREKYLLREEIVRPLSVDEAVWPRLEDERLSSVIFSDPGEPPNGLSLHFIKDAIPMIPKDAAALLGITAPASDAERLRTRHKIEPSSSKFVDLSARGFNHLGYDVADAWLTSGLMNCGYTPDTKIELAGRFLNAINQHGLFSSFGEAAQFRLECDKRIPSHAPFTVFGLWQFGKP